MKSLYHSTKLQLPDFSDLLPVGKGLHISVAFVTAFQHWQCGLNLSGNEFQRGSRRVGRGSDAFNKATESEVEAKPMQALCGRFNP